ncbi:MAG TPA: DEAD/DEAH box helicase [Gemmatimonadales bacterium]|nr:DEAD/DEAH box helicase [Gemmatimonadales bacterium]
MTVQAGVTIGESTPLPIRRRGPRHEKSARPMVPLATAPLVAAPLKAEVLEDVDWLHGELERALDDEIAATVAEERRRAVPVSQGHRLDGPGMGRQYTFRLGAPAGWLKAGQEACYVAQGIRWPVTVVQVRGRTVVLALKEDLGGEAPSGELRSDTAWLLEALQQRLRLMTSVAHGRRAGDLVAHFATGLRALGLGEYRVREGDVPEPLLDAAPPLNEEQRTAVSKAVASNALYVWGPPGCGKTTTLARIAEALVVEGRRVLVVGPTNAAVDLLAERIAERVTSHPRFSRGLVVRPGSGCSRALRRRFGCMVVLDGVVERLRREYYDPRLEWLDAALTTCAERLEAAERGGGAPAALERDAQTLRAQLAHLRTRRDDVAARSATLPESLLSQALVTVTTVHQLYATSDLHRSYDTVIVDEASMVTLPQVYVAATLATRSVIVAGDFRQLPPVVLARTPAAQDWLETDVFHRVGIPEDLARDDEPPYLTILTEQHRMAPAIAALANTLFYEERLRTPASVRQRPRHPLPLGSGALYYLDTSALRPTVRCLPSGSRENPTHAGLVADLLAYLESGTGLPTGPGRGVAVLTPYAAHAERIRRALGDRYDARRVGVTTAHRVQGDEAVLAVVDLCEAEGARVGAFLIANRLAQPGARLLNVALSRARDALVVVAHFRVLERQGGAVVRALLRHLREHGQAIPPAEILGAANGVERRPA